jgi:hypothetical protein
MDFSLGTIPGFAKEAKKKEIIKVTPRMLWKMPKQLSKTLPGGGSA